MGWFLFGGCFFFFKEFVLSFVRSITYRQVYKSKVLCCKKRQLSNSYNLAFLNRCLDNRRMYLTLRLVEWLISIPTLLLMNSEPYHG